VSNIVIRHAEPEDAQAIKAVYQCENTYSQTLQLPFPSNKSWEIKMADIPENVYAFVAEIDGKVVGNLGFEICKNPRRRHVGHIGMGVMDDYQGKGVGTALMDALITLADNWLNIRRIELTVYTDNLAAIKLYEKFGFKTEGEAEDFAFKNGKYVNVFNMARINQKA
jgi:putative acetyltransferase